MTDTAQDTTLDITQDATLVTTQDLCLLLLLGVTGRQREEDGNI